MKIVIIDEEFPFPLNTGKRIRSFHLAESLARRHEVTYMAYGEESSPGYRHLRARGLTPEAVAPLDRRQSGARFYARLAFNLLSRYPYIVTSHYSERFRRRLSELVDPGDVDCVLCEWTPYAVFLRGVRGPKKIIVAHNVESAIWHRYMENERDFARRLYIAEQARKVAAFERECFGWADGATAVSEEDAALLERQRPGLRVAVVENGVNTEYFRPQEQSVDHNMVVFTGSMDWRPNQDAAQYFAGEIFPILQRQRPKIQAFFVGRNPSRRVMELAQMPGIHVTGTVDDVRPYIARAGAYVVPLRIGGGSRLKILEALAMAKAVISTAVGAEGLRVRNGENIIVRDKPAEFAAAVGACLDDAVLAGRLGRHGREMVQQYYRWDELGRKLSDYICDTVKSV